MDTDRSFSINKNIQFMRINVEHLNHLYDVESNKYKRDRILNNIHMINDHICRLEDKLTKLDN